MIKFLYKITSAIFTTVQYIIAPPACHSCREFITNRTILCIDCEKMIIPIAPKLIQINSTYNLTIHAICKYDPPLKNMILAKHNSDHIMFKAIADLIWQKTVLQYIEIDCFIPIPLHWTRNIRRGFNQAEILANSLGRHKKIQVFNMISRIKQTEYQAKIARELRKDNVANAFVIKDGFNITGKHIMLVDDLCTTGSTALQIAKILIKHKPASISLVVACRAL